MIQRIQSIFILIAAILLVTIIIWPIDFFSNAQGLIELHWNGVYDVTPEVAEPLVRSLVPLAAVIAIALALNVVALFLFKRRTIQMRLVGVAAGIEVCVVAVLVYLGVNIADGMNVEWHVCARWALPLIAAIMDFLAYGRISDDEALVRSLDRLR